MQFELDGDKAAFTKFLGRNRYLSIPHIINDEKGKEYRVTKIKKGAIEFVNAVILSDGIEEIASEAIKYYQTLFLPKSLKSFNQDELKNSVVIHSHKKASDLAVNTSGQDILYEVEKLFGDEPKFYQACAFYDTNDFNFKMQEDLCFFVNGGEATVTACIGDEGAVKIPGNITIKGRTYPVTKIGRFAFKNSNITKTEAPQSIKEIQLHAFLKCDKLKEIVMDGVEIIAKEAFAGCTNLVNVSAKNTKVIEERAFLQCRNLENIHIPPKAKIGKDAYEWCFKMKKK